MILVLVLGGTLGWFVRRAHVQRDAVTAIVRSGGGAYYDWETRELSRWDGSRLSHDPKGKSPWPKWLIDALGPDYFGHVRIVYVQKGDADAVMKFVGRLRYLDSLSVSSPGPLTDAGMSHLRGLTRLR